MAEEVAHEVDCLARIQEMDGGRVTEHVNVAARSGKRRFGGVPAKESLNPPRLEAALTTCEERRIGILPACEILLEER
jgi:hypothetical protein